MRNNSRTGTFKPPILRSACEEYGIGSFRARACCGPVANASDQEVHPIAANSSVRCQQFNPIDRRPGREGRTSGSNFFGNALILAFLFEGSNKEKKKFGRVDETNHILATNHA